MVQQWNRAAPTKQISFRAERYAKLHTSQNISNRALWNFSEFRKMQNSEARDSNRAQTQDEKDYAKLHRCAIAGEKVLFGNLIASWVNVSKKRWAG
jgi:hypothetical protein